MDPASQQPENTVVERSDFTRSGSNTSCITGPPPPAPAIAQPAVVGTTLSKEPMTNTHIPPAQSPPPPPTTQPLPYIQSTLFVQPSQSQNTYTYAPFATQQPYPSSQPQMMPIRPFPHTGLPSSQPYQPQIIHAPSAPHTPLPSVQSPMMPMTSNTTSMNGVNLQTPNLATIMTIMEVVRHMDQSSWFSQNQLPVSQQPINSNASTSSERPTTPELTPSTSTFQASGRFQSPGIDGSLTTHQSHFLRNTATAPRKHGSGTEVSEDRPVTRKLRINPSRGLPDEMLTPSTSRKRPPAVKPTNPPSKRLRKGKERAISTDSSEHSEVDELMEASDDSYSTYSSASLPVRPRNIVARKKHGEIFLSVSGQPLRFFVQVDLHGRHTVVTNIKVCLDSISYRKLDANGFSRKTRERLSTILQMPTIRSCSLVLIPFRAFLTRPLL